MIRISTSTFFEWVDPTWTTGEDGEVQSLESIPSWKLPPKKGTVPKGNFIFQPLFFRGHVSFHGGKFESMILRLSRLVGYVFSFPGGCTE